MAAPALSWRRLTVLPVGTVVAGLVLLAARLWLPRHVPSLGFAPALTFGWIFVAFGLVAAVLAQLLPPTEPRRRDAVRLVVSVTGVAGGIFLVTYLPVFAGSAHAATLTHCYAFHNPGRNGGSGTRCSARLDDDRVVSVSNLGFDVTDQGRRTTLVDAPTGWHRQNDADDTVGYAVAAGVLLAWGGTGVWHHLRAARGPRPGTDRPASTASTARP